MHVVIQFDYHSPDHACPITCYFSVPHKNEEVCELDHTDILNFTLQEHTKYFTETYYNTREYAPRRCCGPGCERNFLPEDYSVGIKNPVWTCRNAANAEHECTFALCKDCAPAPTPQKRRRKRPRKFAGV